MSSCSNARNQATDFFSDESRWQSWLDVEAALALTQSEIGMIPVETGKHIAARAHLKYLNLDEMRREIKKTMAPVHTLSECLAKACGDSGSYVHFGATTQNIVETGRLLVLKRVQSCIFVGLADLLSLLSYQAEKFSDTIMVGRTNGQNALPITYGFKIAGWIDELIRVADQLVETEPRLFQLRFGGAIGGYHSFGADGYKLAENLSKRLRLALSIVPNRTSVDPLIEYITRLSALGLAINRISSEFYLLMSENISEVSEVQSNQVVGSSTMPQKINPKYIVSLIDSGWQLRSKAGLAFSTISPSHEGEQLVNRHLSNLLEETCKIAIEVLGQAVSVFSRIKPNIERMRENFETSREALATERLMLFLAKKIGRSHAHHLVHQVSQQAISQGKPLQKIILDTPEIVGSLSVNLINDILLKEEYAGQCNAISKQLAALGLTRARKLRNLSNNR